MKFSTQWLGRYVDLNGVDIDELGEGQEYQLFFSNQLGGSTNGSDPELVVGLDLSANDSFIMPIAPT